MDGQSVHVAFPFSQLISKKMLRYNQANQTSIEDKSGSERNFNMIRIAICDDDLEMLKQLSAMTNNYMQKRAVRAYISTFADAQSMLAHKDPGFDIILLDIRMDGLDGLEAAKLLRKQGDESVLIFVSSILEYAPRGYEVDAFRFILKSDLSSTFERCMSAAIERLLQQEETFRLPSPQGDHWTQLKNIIFDFISIANICNLSIVCTFRFNQTCFCDHTRFKSKFRYNKCMNMTLIQILSTNFASL